MTDEVQVEAARPGALRKRSPLRTILVALAVLAALAYAALSLLLYTRQHDAVDFPAISTAIVDRKCQAIAASGADAVVGGDLGCLLNIEGRLRRRGDEATRVLHIAEMLAGEGG